MLAAAWAGPPALLGSLAGAAVGALVFLPFVWRGWLGGADALLLAAVGAWQGWRVALWAAWWTALVGAALALAVWGWRAHRSRRGTPVPLPPSGADGAAGATTTGAAPAPPASGRGGAFPLRPGHPGRHRPRPGLRRLTL